MAHNPGHMLMKSIGAIALHQAQVRFLPAVSNWNGTPHLSSFLLLWQQKYLCPCKTEVPMILLAVIQGCFELPEDVLIPPSMVSQSLN